MKQTRIVPSSSLVTTVVVSGTPHHYFHSEALGKCRAILITEDENLPRPTPLEELYAELDSLLQKLPKIPLLDEFAYTEAILQIRIVRQKIFEIESK